MPAANTPTPLFNPVAFWADASMAALDTALSSTQNLGDGVDRIARAGAGADATALAAEQAQGAGAPTNLGLGLALRMQSTMLDLLGQAWQQWFTTLGTLATLGAGRSFKEAEQQNPWLNTLRESVAAEAPAPRAASPATGRRQGARSKEAANEERAVAAAAAERSTRSRPRKAARAAGRTRSKR